MNFYVMKSNFIDNGTHQKIHYFFDDFRSLHVPIHFYSDYIRWFIDTQISVNLFFLYRLHSAYKAHELIVIQLRFLSVCQIALANIQKVAAKKTFLQMWTNWSYQQIKTIMNYFYPLAFWMVPKRMSRKCK